MPGKREVNHQEGKVNHQEDKVNHQEDKPTLRKTRSLTRADEQHQREMEEKVKVTEETEKENSHMPKIPNNGFAKKKAAKRSLDKVLVDLKARVGPDAKDAEPEVIEVELEEKSVNIKSLNVKDAAEAQQIIRDLTSQLSKREDEYVEMKAESLSKDQKIRALEQNLGKLDQKFECFKNDREELQKYMKMNVDLIKKLDVLNEAVKARDVEIEALKKVETPKEETVSRQQIETMRTFMTKQNRQLMNLETKMKENQSKEEKAEKEKLRLLSKVRELEEELKSLETLKVENDALRNTIDEKTSEYEDLEKASEKEKKMIETLSGQLKMTLQSQGEVFSKIEAMQSEQISGQKSITKLKSEKKILGQEVTKLKSEKETMSQEVSKLKSALEMAEGKLAKASEKKENAVEEEKKDVMVDLEESLKHKDAVIEQLELENNKLFRQNVENLKAEKEKTKDLEMKVKALEEEKAKWMKKSENREGSKEKIVGHEITLEENVKAEKYKIPKIKRESISEVKEDTKPIQPRRKEGPQKEGMDSRYT